MALAGLRRLTTASLAVARATSASVAPSGRLAALSRQTPLINTARSYHENVLDHYENPRNVGSLDKDKKNVGTGIVGAPACGDVMKLQIEVDDEGRIASAKFKTFGCGSAIASSSLATVMLQGKTLDEAISIKNTDLAKELRLPPVKLHCSMLAEDAIQAAIKDFKTKQDTKGEEESEGAQAHA